MKKTNKQRDNLNLRVVGELPQHCGSSSAEPPQSISDRIRELQGSASQNEFARKCGISGSLLRKYLAGSTPGADKLAKIAIANHVYIDWLSTGRMPKAPTDKIEQSVDAYIIESTLITVIETIEDALGETKLSPSKKSRLISVCSKIYLAMRPEERREGFAKIAMAITELMTLGDL